MDLMLQGNYEEALKAARRGLELHEDIYLYTKLSLSYLLNNEYDSAVNIIDQYKDFELDDVLFKDYIIEKLHEFEDSGIEHPDFEKIQELLKEWTFRKSLLSTHTHTHTHTTD